MYPVNLIIFTEYPRLTSGNLVDMQSQAQLKFRHDNPDLDKDFKIFNIIIDNICYLGQMTESEFRTEPTINLNKAPVIV